MSQYALTSIQLYNQLRENGYSKPDIHLVQNTYEMAQCWFSGMRLGNGKDYISHLVRAASILGFVDAPPSLVAAGLIHNAYWTADFGFGRRGISSAKRRVVQERLGLEVEEYIAGFHSMKWDHRTYTAIRDQLDSADLVYRNVVLLRLADHLEHNLDFGVLYWDEKERNWWLRDRNLPIVIDMAKKLGIPFLAEDLEYQFRENSRVAMNFETFDLGRGNFPPRVIPLSYRKRWSIVLYEKLYPRLNRFRRHLVLSLGR